MLLLQEPFEASIVSVSFLGSPFTFVILPPASSINNLPAVEPKLFVDFKLITATIFQYAGGHGVNRKLRMAKTSIEISDDEIKIPSISAQKGKIVFIALNTLPFLTICGF